MTLIPRIVNQLAIHQNCHYYFDLLQVQNACVSREEYRENIAGLYVHVCHKITDQNHNDL
jgi:hypothetical protein